MEAFCIIFSIALPAAVLQERTRIKTQKKGKREGNLSPYIINPLSRVLIVQNEND
jgi:hypothetical protein